MIMVFKWLAELFPLVQLAVNQNKLHKFILNNGKLYNVICIHVHNKQTTIARSCSPQWCQLYIFVQATTVDLCKLAQFS